MHCINESNKYKPHLESHHYMWQYQILSKRHQKLIIEPYAHLLFWILSVQQRIWANYFLAAAPLGQAFLCDLTIYQQFAGFLVDTHTQTNIQNEWTRICKLLLLLLTLNLITSSIFAVLPSLTQLWKKLGATETPNASDVIPVRALSAFVAITRNVPKRSTNNRWV